MDRDTSVELINPHGNVIALPAWLASQKLSEEGFRYPTAEDYTSQATERKVAREASPAAQLPECRIPQRLVEFDVSSECTRACAFCAPKGSAIAKRRRKKLRLGLERHDKVVRRLREAGYDRPDRCLVYAGHGEPLLHPRLLDMMAAARRELPRVRIGIYTNGDKLSADVLSAFGALQVDVVFDNYDDETGQAVYAAMQASTISRERVRCMDHVGARRVYFSRCGTVGEAEQCEDPCSGPRDRLFLASDGTWRLCCEDYEWITSSPAEGPLELNADEAFAKLRDDLVAGNRQEVGAKICRKCDRRFGGHADFYSHPRLDSIDRLKPAATWPKARKGFRRLVVIPVCRHSQGRDQVADAKVVLDTIDRRSRVAGETLLLWNDPEEHQCPEELRGDPEKRIVFEYAESLGWAGINRAIGEAFQFAVREGYDAVIKMDAADVAVMRDGWDAWLLAGFKLGEMRGQFQQQYDRGWPGQDFAEIPGHYHEHLEALAWSADWCASGRQHEAFFQGGCYVIGRKAIERIDRVIGMPDEREKEIGEDCAFSMRARVLGIPMRGHPSIQSHFSRNWAYHPKVARYFRDCRGVAVIHPIRDPQLLRELCQEDPR